MDSYPTAPHEQEGYLFDALHRIRANAITRTAKIVFIVENNLAISAFNLVRVFQRSDPHVLVATDPRRPHKPGTTTHKHNKGPFLDSLRDHVIRRNIKIIEDFDVVWHRDDTVEGRRAEVMDALADQMRRVRRDGDVWSGKFNALGKRDTAIPDDIVVTLAIAVRNSYIIETSPRSFNISERLLEEGL